MSKEFEHPVPPRTKDEGGRIIEDKAAEARERIGRIEKAATGPAAEAQKAAQAVEERMAEREFAERDVKQRRSDGEAFQAGALSAKMKKTAPKSGRDRDEAREASAYGHERVHDEEDRLTRGHYGAEAGRDDD